jgi:60 kDa SS-A/Ro ribonucleoprotein
LTPRYAGHFSPRQTAQSEALSEAAQGQNNAGGFALAIDDWIRLDRFLVLGAEGGSYYATERELTLQNAESVRRCLEADGPRTVARIVEISEAGRAPKNDPAVFALAMAAGMSGFGTRALALAALPRVCRTGTHLFQFAEGIEAFRGWGRALRRAVGEWYTQKEPHALAYQLSKYQQRSGWSHRDLLRLCHVQASEPSNAALRWAVRKVLPADAATDASSPLAPIVAFEAAKRATTVSEVIQLIREYGLPRECVPTHWLGRAEVWEALLVKMPLGSLVRNLATMTRVGLLIPAAAAVDQVVTALADTDRLRQSRLHPIALLAALKTYAAGCGVRGSGVWSPVPQIVEALDGAFYAAFANAEPTGKRWLLALDVSGSMAWNMIAGIPGLSARDGAAAMALLTASTEANHHIIGFTGHGFRVSAAGASTFGAWAHHENNGGGVERLPIRSGQRLDDAIRIVSDLPMGPTDCSLPMLYALEQKLAIDVFVVYTDSETWHGEIHPVQALQRYRERMDIPAKLIVVGMVSSGFSIADPDDAGMLDVVGFDAAVPQLMSDFASAVGTDPRCPRYPDSTTYL